MDKYYKKISMAELILAAYGDNLTATKTNNTSRLYGNNYRYNFSRNQANKYTNDWQETDHQEGDRRKSDHQKDDRCSNCQEDDRHDGDRREGDRHDSDCQEGDRRDIWKRNDHEWHRNGPNDKQVGFDQQDSKKPDNYQIWKAYAVGSKNDISSSDSRDEDDSDPPSNLSIASFYSDTVGLIFNKPVIILYPYQHCKKVFRTQETRDNTKQQPSVWWHSPPSQNQ